MHETNKDDITLTHTMFEDAMNELIKTNKTKYRFITKAGDDFKNALFNLYKYIWDHELKPDQWKVDTLVQLHKKGSTLDLDNFRFIHMKGDIPKCFGYIVTKTIKDTLLKSFSIYQIGAKPGHRPQEHLFCVRSIISLYKMIKKPLFLSFYDISKFFDKELLEDALDVCYEAGIKGKMYRLIHLLNKDTRIKVKTGVGLTEEAFTGENVGQGTVEGAILSAGNVDKGIGNAFNKSSKEISYGEIRLQPLLFQDDVIRASDSLESLESGNSLVDHVMKEKVLTLNTDKSNFMVIGSSKITKEVNESLKDKTIKLNGNPIKESDTEKYLGDYFHKFGNDQSIVTTVDRRYGKAMESIVDIKSIVEDVRAEIVGAIKTGLEIFVLYNSDIGIISQRKY